MISRRMTVFGFQIGSVTSISLLLILQAFCVRAMAAGTTGTRLAKKEAARSSVSKAGGACAASEYHALDFTIGDWAVTDSQGNAMGTSEIRADLDGCVVVENWTAPGGSPSGRNLDGYNQEDKRWRRYFADTRGHAHVFEGIAKKDSIEYEGTSKGENGEPVLNRLTISKDGPDKMKQLWQKSHDGGRTWETAFQGNFNRMRR